MSTRIPQQQVLWALWRKRLRGCALLWMVLCILGGCNGGQATPPPPTATNAPPAATAVPEPTATPAPELTATPVSMEDIAYSNLDNPVTKRTLSILHPESGSPPYPVILLTYAHESRASDYTAMVEALLSRGYAVVQLGGSRENVGAWDDGFCAWAWLEANAASYDLDMNRALVFNHGIGIVGGLLGLGDKALWTEMLKYCPSPMPSTVHIKGVVTYNGWFLIPEGSLTWFGYFVLPTRMTDIKEDPQVAVARLVEIPYDEWRTTDQLDEPMRHLASQLPLYYVSDPNPSGERPAFLLLYSDAENVEIPSSESLAFAPALEKGGIPVQLQEISSSDFWSLKELEIAARIADAIDVFAQQLFAAAP